MSLVDLHVHTVFSDGYDQPGSVVKMAAEHDVSVMGVTDHDNLGGIAEAMAAGKKNGVKVVPGVEISTSFHGRTIHMLSYGFSLDDPGFNSFLKKLYSFRKEGIILKIEKISADFVAAGKKPVDMDDFIRSQGEYFNREKAAQYLVVNGFMPETEAAFQVIAKTKIARSFPVSSADAVNAIHQAGGVAILAHPFAHGTSLRSIDPTLSGQEELLKEMITSGIDGFECHQSEYGPEETSFALGLAKKYKMLVSAGSDWHGALCDVGWDIKDFKSHYPEHIGGLGITTEQVAPLLGRLGIAVDKA